MRNKEIFIVLIMLTILTFGCASIEEAQPPIGEKYIDSIQEDQNKPHQISPAYEYKARDLSEIKQISFDVNNEFCSDSYDLRIVNIVDENKSLGSYFDIKYPQMCGYADKDKETVVNKIIRRLVDEYCSSIDINHNYNECMEINYSITYADESILSICYFGFVSYNSKISHFTKTITAELQSPKIVALEDVSSFKVIEDNIINMRYLSSREDLDYVYQDNNEILQFFRESFTEEKRYTENFYIKENAIGVVIWVYPAQGDYLILEFEK